MTTKLFVSLAGAILLCAATTVTAQDTSVAPGGGTYAACKTDIDTLCKDAAGAEGRGKFRCLRDNEAKVSAGCKTALDTAKAVREAARAACKADRETLCKEAGDERGAGMKCLRDNAAKVSPACSKALAALPARGK
jgi:hypothetical protein